MQKRNLFGFALNYNLSKLFVANANPGAKSAQRNDTNSSFVCVEFGERPRLAPETLAAFVASVLLRNLVRVCARLLSNSTKAQI